MQKANENNINQTLQRRPQIQRNLSHAIVHWDTVGIVNSYTRVEDIVSPSQISSGWKVAACEITPDPDFVQMLNNNYVKSLKHKNNELMKAAKETKKYAEKVKDDNDKVRAQLDKANKKIKSIELAKGFDKCNDELLDKWEKIFTN